jgi:acyl-coenzyme A thioesterase PaaI-like protein
MSDEVNTHLEIDHALCGEPVSVGDGEATTRFVTTDAMAVDDRGLVHGGFVFGLADHAAMLAVNDPNVVLGAAEVRFDAPVKVGEEVTATARITGEKGKKRTLESEASVGDRKVMSATFTAFVLDQHVLDS